jgi:fatty acid kinase
MPELSAAGQADRHSDHTDASVVRFRALLIAGLAALEQRREEVNALNVFPVADGDAGDNMVLTLQAAVDELDRLADRSEGGDAEEIGRDEIVASVARAALLGARGSSGVILSQLIRGAAEELASRPGELVDPVLIGAALARAVDQAYGSVRDPAEGTILTVAREMAHRVASELAHGPDSRLRADVSAAEQDFVIADLIESAVQAGEESVAHGPERLPALRAAGVVDAGGFGLIVLLGGIVAALRGSELPARAQPQSPAPVTDPRHVSITYRYCTNFAVTGTGLEPRRFVTELDRLGDSVLVVGDAQTLRVHVHTDRPAAAEAVFAGVGEVSHVDVFDMREQLDAHDPARRR